MRDATCVRCFSHISTFCVYPALVQHVSVTAAGARGDSASVAYSADVNGLAAVCDAVTPSEPCAARAVPSARSACICDVSCAVALARGDARAATDLFTAIQSACTAIQIPASCIFSPFICSSCLSNFLTTCAVCLSNFVFHAQNAFCSDLARCKWAYIPMLSVYSFL